MYDEDMLVDIEGESNGEEIIRTVSEPDSYFPESLTLYDDIVSVGIVAEDDCGERPEEYEISVPVPGYAFIHSPYNIEVSGGGTMMLYNPPRLLRIRLKNGDVHYFPFSGGERGDTKSSYEKEVADLFDDKYEDIKILRKAAKAIKLIEGLSDDIYEYEIDEGLESGFEEHFFDQGLEIEQIKYYFQYRPLDMWDYAYAYEYENEMPEFEEEGETRLHSFMNAMKWLGERNSECFRLRLDKFLRYTSGNSDSDDEPVPFL